VNTGIVGLPLGCALVRTEGRGSDQDNAVRILPGFFQRRRAFDTQDAH